jgi:hypothetical protein
MAHLVGKTYGTWEHSAGVKSLYITRKRPICGCKVLACKRQEEKEIEMISRGHHALFKQPHIEHRQ